MSVLLFNLEKPELEYYFHEMIQAFLPGVKTILSGEWEMRLSQRTISDQVELTLENPSEVLSRKTYPFKNYSDQEDKGIYKGFLYDFLAQYYKKELMWGNLTGVKPVKIVQKLIYQGFGEKEIIDKLMNYYRVSEDRSELLIDLAKKQKSFIDFGQSNNRISIYIGIPLCPSKCSYCSFVSTIVNKNNLDCYFENLLIEIEKTAQLLARNSLCIDTLYIGGGTPTVLGESQLSRLLEVLSKNLDLSKLREYTLEAGRPDTITEDKLIIAKNYGIDRICLNPQSMNKDTLLKVSRPYQEGEIEKWVDIIHKLKFKTLSMDLIIGLANERPEDFMRSLDQLLCFKPENITIHNLAIKKGSMIKNDYGIKVNAGYGEDFYQAVKKRLSLFDYHPYYLYRLKYSCGNSENIGYSQLDHEGIYNIMMMSETQTILGIGAGATANLYFKEKDLIKKIFTIKDVKTYNERFDKTLEKKLMALEDFFKINHLA